ncbi:DNA-directed RNA polymerase subunit E'' [Candidatus Woesearchaeota archaeon]|nr:DNA-directed RNA polymerase subunit E'' [Candidatus Woesearchaeota archaeon]
MRKACRQCRILVESGACPICKNSDFGASWNGRVIFISASKSSIAKKLSIAADGDYALKVR